MALTIIYMIAFSIILAIRNIKNKYNLLFILMVFGMSISMFTILSEIYKSSNYLIPSIYFHSRIEYSLFLLISKILRLTLSDLLILRNLGIVTYLIAIMLFSISFNKSVTNNLHGVNSKKQNLKHILLGLFPLIYFFFYHPNTAYYIYLKRHTLTDLTANTWFSLIYVLDFMIVVITFLYLMYPISLLIKSYRSNRISFFNNQLLALAVSLGLLNLTFFSMFFTGSFKTSVQNVYNSGFWRYKLATFIPEYYTIILPVLSLIILLVILLITIKFKTDRMINGLKERSIKKNLRILNANVKDVLHSNKNIMFNLKILSEEALKSYGTAEGRVQIQKILSLSTNHMDSITKTLDNIKELKFRTINHNLIDAIDDALNEITIPKHIKIIKNYHVLDAHCKYDTYHIKQVFINLITNSIDAINSVDPMKMLASNNKQEGIITITLDSSIDWIYFSITDNGCGIPRKLQKKIFTPYFSTKSKQNNWGIGLSYVFRVITYHYGHLRIKSVPKEYTTVEILLPKSHNSVKNNQRKEGKNGIN